MRNADACRIGAQILRSVEQGLTGVRFERYAQLSSLIVALEDRADDIERATELDD